ncbi:THO complex subunit 2 [Tulasnella sp. 417]|nr:THO complex subunit 2 [Tulasnella sp. 417]
MANVALPDIQQAVSDWENSGKDGYFNVLRPHVLNAEDPASRDVLLEGFYILVKATTSLSGSQRLQPAAFASLVMSFTEGLPSTSKDGHVQWNTPLVAVLEDIILDTIWTVETELEDQLPDGQKSTAADEDKKPLAEILQILLSRGVLRRSVCRDRLEFGLLGLAKLVDLAKVSSRVARVRTAMLYKQRKFNLLRETNEGYSKLISEITSLVGPPHSSETGQPTESLVTIRKRARAAWEKVVGTIGYFDLDPNRVLDVLLDVFSTYLIAHHQFFLELVRCSGWSRSRVSSENAGSNEMTVDEPTSDKYAGKSFEEVLKIAEQPLAKDVSAATDANTPILGDVLGFKFAHYQAPGSAQDSVKPLYFLTALLIREGFLELSDVYDHLTPLDPALAAMEEKAIQWARKQLVTPPKFNALANAAALESSYHHRGSNSNKEEEAKKPEDEPDTSNGPHNQKLSLLKALLAVGAAHPAFSIISKFPWIVHAYSDVADLVLRITKQSLKPFVSRRLPTCQTASKYASSNAQAKIPFTGSGNTAPTSKPKEHVLVFDAPSPVGTMSRNTVFFYPYWRQLIPACNNDEDLVWVVQPLLQLLGTRISRSPNVVIDLCKLGSLALSAIDSQTAEQKELNEDADKRTRQIWSDLLRLYLLPATSLITANYMVSNAIWNLVSRFPTETRWMFYEEWSSYGADKLASRLHPELVIQTKETRREIRDILRRISSSVSGRAFSIPIYHLMHSNPIPLFSVALSQIQSYPNFPAHVAEALEYMTPLGYDVLVHNVIGVFADPNKETLKQDGTSLVDWIHNLASFTGKMLRAHRELSPETFLRYILHQLHNNSIKEVLLLSEIVSTMTSITPPADYNDTQVAASSGELLSASLRTEEYANFVPSLSDLCTKYGLEPAVAFHIVRPAFEKAFTDSSSPALDRKEAEVKEKLRARQNAAATGATPASAPAADATSTISETWPPVLVPVIEAARTILPPRALELMGPHFFATFWQMSLADLIHLQPPYEAAIKNCENFSKRKDPIDASPSEREIAADNRRLSDEVKSALLVELRQSVDRYASGLLRLRREKGEWFKHLMGAATFPSVPLMNEIVQHCILPRVLMSPLDAEYCATFIKVLHRNATTGFSTLVCYDRLIGDQLATTIASCSDREIVNFSRFLRLILKELDGWLDPRIYMSEQATTTGVYLPGLVKKVTSLGKPKFEQSDLLSSNEIGSFIQKLHKKILKAAMTCLESNEYRPVKNVFLVLNEILPVFPMKKVNAALGITLQPAVKAFLTDERDDIKVLATGYCNKFELNKSEWLPEMPASVSNTVASSAPSPVPPSTSTPVPPETSTPPSTQAQPPASGHASGGQGNESTAAPTSSTSAAQQSVNGLPAKPQSVVRTPSSGSGNLQTGLLSNPTGSRSTLPAGTSGSSSSTSHRPSERPEFIPRGKTGVPPSAAGQDSKTFQPPAGSGPTSSTRVSPGVSSLPAKPRDLPPRPDSRSDVTQSPRPTRRSDDTPGRSSQPMPPPTAPSSKPTAQDLRSSARGPTGRDDSDDRSSRAQRRSSPPPSRPGTRNPSADSRTSDPARVDRGSNTRDRGDRASKREREQESDREQDRSGGRNKNRDDDRDRRGDRDRDRERDKERDRDRDREKDKDRERERDKSGRDRERHRREREPSGRKERDRDGNSVPSSSRGGRREEDRAKNESPRDDPSRLRPDEVSHKRRREDEDGGPSKRLRENERDVSRSPPRDTAREANGREKRDSNRPYSPNGRDRYRGDDERRAKEANGRDGNRHEEPRSLPPRDRERDREKDRNPRDGDKREDRAKGERARRDGVRDGDRERERERLDGRSDAPDGSRRDRKERETAERPSDRRDSLDQGKKANASATAGPPSEPRAMKANKSTISDASTARVGALHSDTLAGNSSSSRAVFRKKVKDNLLLALLAPRQLIGRVPDHVEINPDQILATVRECRQSAPDLMQVVTPSLTEYAVVLLNRKAAKSLERFELHPMAAISDTPGSDGGKTIAELIAQHLRDSVRQHWAMPHNTTPLIAAIQGPQGSGKTTAARAVKALLEESEAYNIALLSIDDLYLPHDGLRSVAAAHPNNPLLNGRGHPGTHDLELGRDILERLKQSNVPSPETKDAIILPVFDKSLNNGEGDRLPEDSGIKVEGGAHLVIIEGWCLGFYPLSDQELEKRYNAVQSQDDGSDPVESKRRQSYSLQDLKDVNGYLKSYVDVLYPFFTCFAQIIPGPDPIALTYQWRLQQEHDMKALNGGRGMTDEQVKAYIPGYIFFADGMEKGYNTDSGIEPVLEKFPPWRGHHLRVMIDKNRAITKTENL